MSTLTIYPYSYKEVEKEGGEEDKGKGAEERKKKYCRKILNSL